MIPLTRPLARYVVQARFEDFPPAVRHAGTRAFVNWLGCVLGGCREAVSDHAIAAYGAFAGPPQATLTDGRTRVATKYSKVAREYYARLGVQAEVIKLYGSMELAPLVGLADRIVDLVDTGNTLRANGLVEFETICEISSRLIVNKAAMKTKHKRVSAIIAALRAVVNDA